MRFHLLLCAIVLALAACSTTVSRDEAASGAAGQSYILVVADGVPTDKVETHDFAFRRVDMASSTFRRELAYVRFGHKLISGGGDEFQVPATMAATALRFAGTTIAPGDYALVYHYVHTSLGTSAMVNLNCFSRGAGIYRFREGTINIVRLGKPSDISMLLSGALSAVEVNDPAALQAQVTGILAGYPKMNAPLLMASLLGTARFDTGQKKNCKTTGGFSFNRAPGVSVDW
jgi:hypothetical protein